MPRTVLPGKPYPQGATWDGTGVNFSVYSEKATGIGSHFASSLELTPANEQTKGGGRSVASVEADANAPQKLSAEPGLNASPKKVTPPEVVAATQVHRSPQFPSGF